MALGATREGIATMILRQGGVLIVAGLVAGLVLAIFAGQLVKSFLYNVKPVDLGTYVGVAFMLLIVGSIASLIPAYSASTIEPMEALSIAKLPDGPEWVWEIKLDGSMAQTGRILTGLELQYGSVRSCPALFLN